VPLALVVWLAFADPALAASEVGRNVGREIRSWATALLLGVAGLMAVPVLAKRDINGGLILVLLVVLIGGFVFAQDAVRAVIEALWRSIGT